MGASAVPADLPCAACGSGSSGGLGGTSGLAGWMGEVCWDALEMLDVSSLVKNSSLDFKVGMNLDFLSSTC